MDPVIVIAIIGAIPGVIALYLQFRKNKVEEKLSDSEITEKITAAAGVMMDKMQAQIVRLEAQVIRMEAQIVKLEARVSAMQRELDVQDKQIELLKKGINKLIIQIRKLGEEPCWTPDDL